jgi:hypothetical protein
MASLALRQGLPRRPAPAAPPLLLSRSAAAFLISRILARGQHPTSGLSSDGGFLSIQRLDLPAARHRHRLIGRKHVAGRMLP